jgi:hypothetical protein
MNETKKKHTYGPNDGYSLGNAAGNPGVFMGNPHPYPSKPTPAATGMGFDGYGLRVL